ncbi:MAG: sugar transferase [Pseudomonadota bacterium]
MQPTAAPDAANNDRQGWIETSGAVGPAQRRGLLSGASLRTGYAPESDVLDQIINRGAAAFFLVFLAPVFALLVIAQKLTTKGDIFYRGVRLGKDRKPFHIYKFRTLETEASQLTVAQTLARRTRTETPLGGYFRHNRLDELPQLFNILKGDMVFFGPRPIRPEMEPAYQRTAADYDTRFRVRPGLVGLAQAFMSHGTPKAARMRLNRMLCTTPVRYPQMVLVVLYVGLHVSRKVMRMCFDLAFRRSRHLRGGQWITAGFAKPSNCTIEVFDKDNPHIGVITGISDETVQFVTYHPVEPGRYRVRMVRSLGGKRRRAFWTDVTVCSYVPAGCGQVGLLHYGTYAAGSSDYNRYVLENYFLMAAVCS